MSSLDLAWLAVGIVCFWGVAVFLYLHNINATVEEIKKTLVESQSKKETL